MFVVLYVCILQVLAAGCLTALCASAGGQEGCALAEQAEIDVLLEALLSPCFSVRDATLRVCILFSPSSSKNDLHLNSII